MNRTPGYVNDWNRKRYKHVQAVLAETKLTAGCADCGYSVHPQALDFDHMPGTNKRFGLSRVRTHGWPVIWKEVAKCEIVCANCHRIRTYARNQEVGV